MKIAILGSRGIPAVIGGFETFAEEVGTRLAAKGHDITVYCERKLYPERRKNYKGVKLVYLPALNSKSFEALSYDFLGVVHSLLKQYDILYMLADNTAVLLTLPRIFGKKIVVNTDGIEWLRSKWPWHGKLLIKFNEWMATKLTPHLIVDSKEMGAYYKQRYDRKTTYITNGAELIESIKPERVMNLGLEPGKYMTVICRLEPENNIETIVREFKKVETDIQLAVAGGANYRSKYVQHLLEMSRNDRRILFLGVIKDTEMKRELRTNCLAYIHGHQVGGTNPSLLEAMGAGNIILANKNRFNMEVAGETALYWTKREGELEEKIRYVLANDEFLRPLGEKARKRAAEFYNWETIASEHEDYFQQILEK